MTTRPNLSVASLPASQTSASDTVPIQFLRQLADRNTPENFDVYIIPGPWNLGLRSDIGTIRTQLSAYAGKNPVSATQPFSYTRDVAVDLDTFDFTYSPKVLNDNKYTELEFLFVNQSQYQYNALKVGVTLRAATSHQYGLSSAYLNDLPDYDRIKYLEHTSGLRYYSQSELPYISPFHNSPNQLGVAIHPFAGAKRCWVRVMFIDPADRTISSLIEEPIDEFPTVFEGEGPIHRYYNYVKGKDGVPLAGKVGVIAYANDLPTGVVTVHVPG